MKLHLNLSSDLKVLFIKCMLKWVFIFSDVGDSPSDHVQEDMDSEVYPSEDGMIRPFNQIQNNFLIVHIYLSIEIMFCF